METQTEILNRARDLLAAGDVVAIPTETVYGLAARIDSEAALRKVFHLKGRPFFDPLIVHVASFKQAALLTSEWTPLADFLARRFWPGPLTLVLKKAPHVNSVITSGLETVAIRYPNHPLALELIRLCNCPLAAPSANLFGKTSPSTAEHVKREFPNAGLLVIDGGPCQVGIESTVIAVEETSAAGQANSGLIRILRPGAISEEALKDALTRFSQSVTVTAGESSASPGHLRHHYMPAIPLVIVDDDEGAAELSSSASGRLNRQLGAAADGALELKLGTDPNLAARELYSEMRRLTESGASAIYVRAMPQYRGGLWTAIWDRLRRASTYSV